MLVTVEDQPGYRVLTLNRPERLNALNAAMHRELMAALTAAEADEGCRALLLTGAGKGFCAGQDLADVDPAGAPDLAEPIETFYNPLIRKLRRLPLPVVCAVNGVAAGAGANIALACDIVLAGHSAKFLQAFVRIGLIPDSGGTWLLPRLVGDARARGLAMLGEALPAETAAQWGMIWQAVEDDALLSEAHRLAAHLAAQPTAALALLKQALDAAGAQSLDRQLDLERDLQAAAGRTPDYAEGVRAFIEKRPAHFTGRGR